MTGPAFDYTGFEPMDDHGSRFHNRKKTDQYGLRYQVAGPFKPEGCAVAEPRHKSYGWMRVLVWRRDERKCQSCGVTVQIDKSWKEVKETRAESDTWGEVQHIVPKKDGGTDCGHNLVLLCRKCHVATFRRGYGGIPNLTFNPKENRQIEDFTSAPSS
jgi:hypothetical protein